VSIIKKELDNLVGRRVGIEPTYPDKSRYAGFEDQEGHQTISPPFKEYQKTRIPELELSEE